jgi:putative transposase
VAANGLQASKQSEKLRSLCTLLTRIEGIDVGITRFATLSDGRYIKPLNTFRKHEKRLVKYQRCMSHIKQHSSKQFSNNWKKAKARVQKIHTDIANVRKDFLHKTTTSISKNHAIACIEDLQIRNMSQSAVLTEATQGWLNATPERSRNPRSL